MAVRLAEPVLARYRRVSLANSPYPAHQGGRAIDLYPAGRAVPSPVAGTVVAIERRGAPTRPRTRPEEIMLAIDTGTHYARILHVEPSVEPGASVAVGDDLGQAVRTGFFDPWVAPHVHLEFRPPQSDLRRPTGGRPIRPAIEPIGLSWDGTGTVVEVGPEYAVLDVPAHPSPGASVVGLATDDGGVLDGGIPHYGRGVRIGGSGADVSLLGTTIGRVDASSAGMAHLTLESPSVTVDGQPITGLSCVLARDGSFGARLIEPPRLSLGETVTVAIAPGEG